MRWRIPLAMGILAVALALVSGGHAQSVTTPVETAFASLGNHLVIAYGYDPASVNPWKAYDPSAPSFANQLREVEPLGGYFVRVDQDVDFTVGPLSKRLKAGWNLVGWPGGVAAGAQSASTLVDEAFASLGDHLVVAYGYDPASANPWKTYDPTAPSFASQLREVEPLGGYFVRVDQDVDFTVGPLSKRLKAGWNLVGWPGGSGSAAVSTPTPTPTPDATPMPRGTVDPDLYVDVYQSDKAWPGTTLLADNHNPTRPRIIEVNMLGEIVWEYVVPESLKQRPYPTNPGFDVELLPNNNILFVLPLQGIYEIDRNGTIVWSYLTSKISHDADRLPSGNTLFVFGADDQKGDAQVTEINPAGEIIWTWYARDYFDNLPYNTIYAGGWTHTNGVQRLSNGNTLISPRNFNFVVEVDPQGLVVRTIGEGILREQHDPEILPGGTLLAADHSTPERAVEIDPQSGEITWQFAMLGPGVPPVRDANRLPNGNTLITASTKIVEVTPRGEVVWQFRLRQVFMGPDQAARGFYKAERISTQR